MRRDETGLRRARATSAKRPTEVLGDALVEALCVAADGGFVSDPEGSIILWNDAAEALLGYEAADVLGRPCCTLLCGENSDGCLASTAQCAIGRDTWRGKPTPTFDLQTRTKAGSVVWVNVSVLVIADTRTRAPFIVHLFRDVTFATEQLALVREGGSSVTPAGAAGALTRREGEVLRLMGDGFNTAAMAQRLHVSRATVRNHVQNILLKLDVHSRLEAVAYGRRHRLI